MGPGPSPCVSYWPYEGPIGAFSFLATHSSAGASSRSSRSSSGENCDQCQSPGGNVYFVPATEKWAWWGTTEWFGPGAQLGPRVQFGPTWEWGHMGLGPKLGPGPFFGVSPFWGPVRRRAACPQTVMPPACTKSCPLSTIFLQNALLH